MNKKTIVFIMFSLFGLYSAQLSPDQALQKLQTQYPQEKIYMLTDKPFYLAGDQIWFTSTVFNGFSLSEISTNFFVELYDRNKKLIERKRLPIYNGQVSGSLTLPKDLQEDVYFIRAYTPMLSNFSEHLQYYKEIPVYNEASAKKLVKNINAKWNVTVHPEGGNLLNGVESKVAVRMHTPGAPPTEWSGVVTEKQNPQNKITEFKNFDENVGIFTLKPEKDKDYQLTVKDQNGNQQTVDLPKPTENAVTLKVLSEKDQVKYSIQTSAEAPQTTYYTVIGNMGENLVYKAKINQLKDAYYSIPTDQLINGILQLTVFDDHDKVLTKRLCFVMPQELKTKLPQIKENLAVGAREKNTIEISPEKNITSYSAVVLDADADNPFLDENMLSTLWLTGDIVSHIEKPAQYFSDQRNNDALDALLISEEWKRFDWNEVLSGNFPTISNPPSKYISYRGRLSINAKPSPDQSINLITQNENSGTGLYQVSTDEKGDFALVNMIFEKPLKIIYQVNGINPNLKDFVRVYANPVNTYKPLKGELPPVYTYTLEERQSGETVPAEVTKIMDVNKFQQAYDEKVTTIEEVKLKANKRSATQKLNEELSSPLYRSMNETVFDFVNEEQNAAAYTNVIQWLQGRVAGLRIEYENGDPTPYIRNQKANIYINEMQMDANAISGLSTNDIAMVKVVKGPLVGATGGGGGGSVLIYTKRGNDIKNEPLKNDLNNISNIQFFVMNGYSPNVPYPSPDYSSAELRNFKNDTRSILYWNPRLETDGDTPATIDFYNNDTAKKFRVVVMGFDNENYIPVYYEKIIP